MLEIISKLLERKFTLVAVSASGVKISCDKDGKNYLIINNGYGMYDILTWTMEGGLRKDQDILERHVTKKSILSWIQEN